MMACLLPLQGCGTLFDRDTPSSNSVYDAVGRIDLKARKSSPSPANEGLGEGVRVHAETYGAEDTGAESKSPIAPPKSEGERFDLDLQSVPIETAARSILGDIVGAPYMVDSRIQGTVTLASARPLPRKSLIASFEAALQSVGAALVKDQDGYRIIPMSEAAGQSALTAAGSDQPGYGVTIFPLTFVSVDTIQKLLEGFSTQPGMVRAVPARNILIIKGTGAERQSAVETALAFDQDWMKGQTVGVYSLVNSTPEALITELVKIFDNGDGGSNAGLIQFQSIARLNGILVIAKKSELLSRAATWISRLDKADSSATAARVYRVKYGDAKQLAQILNDAFGVSGSGYSVDTTKNDLAGIGATDENSNSPPSSGMGVQSGLSEDQKNTKPTPFFGLAQKILPADQFSATPKGETSGATTSSGAGGASHDRGTRAHITADITTNSLLIFADQETASMIYKVIDQIDRPRLQVAIQATIAEVSLNNALQYGVQYYLKNNIGSLNLANGQADSGTRNTTPLLKTLPGFNALLGSETDPNAILTALSSKTNVKVLSTPSLVVLDNQTASLQVGDQVPVSTTQATIVNGGNNGGFPVANNIDYRNTGVILRVLPRVAANGSVTLNVDQEISNVTNPGTAANLTPTIAQRRVRSSIAVNSGQTVLLAGLISDRDQADREGIPLLERLTLLGDLFATNSSTLNRTELIIFIKPQIIYDAVDAQAIAEDMRARMTAKPFKTR